MSHWPSRCLGSAVVRRHTNQIARAALLRHSVHAGRSPLPKHVCAVHDATQLAGCPNNSCCRTTWQSSAVDIPLRSTLFLQGKGRGLRHSFHHPRHRVAFTLTAARWRQSGCPCCLPRTAQCQRLRADSWGLRAAAEVAAATAAVAAVAASAHRRPAAPTCRTSR